ncbi:MAG: hypothetical protein CMO80_24905 [Verrucomicrobiales bacterium]|nr:hypothetical protein [Verrucomicrobiales bacterium]
MQTSALQNHRPGSRLRYDRRFGARPLQRAIEKHITTKFSRMILELGGEKLELTADLGENNELSIQ